MGKLKIPTFQIIVGALLLSNVLQCHQSNAYAAPPTKPELERLADLSDLSPVHLESWILLESKAPQPLASDLSLVQAEIESRLRAGKEVTDLSIVTVAYLLRNSESPALGRQTPKDKDGHLFPQTKKYISTILLFPKNKSSLKSDLHQTLGSLDAIEGDYAQAINKYKLSLDEIVGTSVELVLPRQTALLNIAEYSFNLGKLREARSYYEKAIFPYYTIQNDQEKFSKLRDIYIAAGLGLIKTNSNNLDSLKKLKFVYNAMSDLGKPLQDAISVAQKNKDRMDEKIKNSVK